MKLRDAKDALAWIGGAEPPAGSRWTARAGARCRAAACDAALVLWLVALADWLGLL